MIRLSQTLLASILVATTAWSAEPYDLNLQNFRPAMDARSMITVERSRVLGTFEPTLGLYMNFARQPLTQSIDGEDEALVEQLIMGNFNLAIGFFNVIQIGAMLPVSVVRADGDGPGDELLVTGDGIGDLEALLKIMILDEARFPVGIAIATSVAFPTGQTNAFVSHGQSVLIRPKLIIDGQFSPRWAWAANFGAALRETRRLAGEVSISEGAMMTRTARRDDPIVFGQAATYRLGVAWSLVPERSDLVFETYGEVPLIADAEGSMPVEVALGMKLYLLGNSFFSFGVSHGVLGQVGDPLIRGFAGIVFEPTDSDRDRDGILDEDDRCPDQPEDFDQYEDADGCPDPDNDSDQIMDLVDQCPNEPEDVNGYEDQDGCPEGSRDRDRDGIADVSDRCPNEPEDKDNFRDEDGCPEPDNDLDGVLDGVDRCPLVPEDVDGFEDQDGCPDLDNDKDRIPDTKDRCPDMAENYDGVDDEDGCPELNVVVTREKIEINEKIYFETDKAVIKSNSHDLLDAVAATLRQFSQIDRVEIQGHTDSRGDDEYNLDLSQRRADAVKAFLIERGQVSASRLTSRGYGETQPVDASETRSAWSKNRRVEFIILKDNPAAE